MKVVLFNAPPRAGKDTASDLGADLVEREEIDGLLHSLQFKFASPLFSAVQGLFGLDTATWVKLYNDHKDEPSDHLMGMSPREAMIWMSEDVAKPKFGRNFFGRIASKQIGRHVSKWPYSELVDDLAIFYSDCGFSEEVVEVVQSVGADDCFLVRIERPGCTYVSDSRNYINPEEVGIADDNFFIVENSGSLDDLESRLEDILSIISK